MFLNSAWWYEVYFLKLKKVQIFFPLNLGRDFIAFWKITDMLRGHEAILVKLSAENVLEYDCNRLLTFKVAESDISSRKLFLSVRFGQIQLFLPFYYFSGCGNE